MQVRMMKEQEKNSYKTKNAINFTHEIFHKINKVIQK